MFLIDDITKKPDNQKIAIIIGSIIAAFIWIKCYQAWKNRHQPSTRYLLLWRPLQNILYPFYRIVYKPAPVTQKNASVTQLVLYNKYHRPSVTGPHPKIYLVYFSSCSYYPVLGDYLNIRPDVNDSVYFFRACYCRQIHSKMSNWYHYINYYGLDNAQHIMPLSYRLDHYRDYQRFLEDIKNDPTQHWLVKLDIDKKKGLYLYRNLSSSTIQQLSKQPSLIQKLQPFPYLINSYRTSFRFYLAAYCQPEGFNNLFLYHDGLVLYSQKPYQSTSNSLLSLLAGYPDSPSPSFYQKNNLPRTYRSLSKSPVSMECLTTFFEKVFQPFRKYMCSCEIDSKIGGRHHRVHVYGADVGFHRSSSNGSFSPYLYELNSGPQQIYPGQEDFQQLILKMYRGLFQQLSIIPQNDTMIGNTTNIINGTTDTSSNNWIRLNNLY